MNAGTGDLDRSPFFTLRTRKSERLNWATSSFAVASSAIAGPAYGGGECDYGPEPEPYDDVRDLIADKVANQKSVGERRKLIDRLRTQALIEWKNDELKKLYEAHVARQGAANGLL